MEDNMTSKAAKVQAQPEVSVNGHGQMPEDPAIDAPWNGEETPDFSRIASRRHGHVRAQLATEKLTEVAVRRPSGQEYIRVKPCPEGRHPLPLIRDERQRYVWYVVDPDLEVEFEEYITLGYVVEVMSNVKDEDGQQEVFLWVLPLQDHNGRDNEWWESWREIASIAETRWVGVRSGKRRAYPKEPKVAIPEP